jgi:hypothetical protein
VVDLIRAEAWMGLVAALLGWAVDHARVKVGLTGESAGLIFVRL